MRTLETERLVLKAYSIEDAEGLYNYAKNPNVGPHAGWKPHESVEESLEIIESLFLPAEAWAIRLKGDSRIIGTIAFEEDRHRDDMSKEIGYSLAEDAWGKGYMTEACGEVLRFAFDELCLNLVGICTGPQNKRSQSVIRKCGFVYEGRLRKAYHTYTGIYRDSLCYSILKEEWRELTRRKG